MYWWDRWRDRPQLSARFVRVGQSRLVIEVENTSPNPNSLRPEVLFDGFDIVYQPVVRRCEVQENDRSLPPFMPRTFTLLQADRIRRSEDIRFLRFPTVRVAPTRGRPRVLRYGRLTDSEALSWWRYWTRRLPDVFRGKGIVERGYQGFQALAQEYEDQQGPDVKAECPTCAEIQPAEVEFASLAADPDGSIRFTCLACGGEAEIAFADLLVVHQE